MGRGQDAQPAKPVEHQQVAQRRHGFASDSQVAALDLRQGMMQGTKQQRIVLTLRAQGGNACRFHQKLFLTEGSFDLCDQPCKGWRKGRIRFTACLANLDQQVFTRQRQRANDTVRPLCEQ